MQKPNYILYHIHVPWYLDSTPRYKRNITMVNVQKPWNYHGTMSKNDCIIYLFLFIYYLLFLKNIYRKGTFLVSYFSVQDLIWLFMQTPIYPELLQNYKHA